MRPPRPMPKPAPARIWGFVASEAPRIVLLRRGPSKWTQMWLWNTETDEFEAGSWFAGHIYYSSCKLSPDGEHFLYSAYNASERRRADIKQQFGLEKMDEWTSLCKPPRFHSVGLWAFSSSYYIGHFLGNSQIEFFALLPLKWINNVITPPKNFKIIYNVGHNWEDVLPSSCLDKLQANSPAADLAGVSWADLDQQGRLVYARNGCVYRHTDAGEQLLADLNASQPQRPWLEPKQESPASG